MSRALAAALARLLEGASNPSQAQACQASAFTALQRRALEDLARSTGALRLKPEGRGSVYEVVSVEVLTTHLRALRPQQASEIDPALPRRAANIAQSRSSKGRSHGHALHYLLVKSISGGVIWHGKSPEAEEKQETQQQHGCAFDLSQATDTAGAGVLATTEDDDWHSDEPLWLVENQALFDRLDWLPPDAQGTVAYYAGQLPGRLLKWLAYRPRAPEVIVFPDYDGVGLLNYARVLEVCASPTRFWLMPDWSRLLTTYGSHAVWLSTQQEFEAAVARLQTAQAPPEVMAMCTALRAQGLALEHESVWLGMPSSLASL
jgi:hypothetical protein